MAHEAKLRHPGLQPPDLGGRRIVAAVIDIDDLVPGDGIERGGDLGDQRGDVAGLVLDRNDDRKINASDDAGSP
jgi:hypothetical protein